MDVIGFFSGITLAANAYQAAVKLCDEAAIMAATNDLTTQLTIAGAHCLSMNEKVAQATESERALKAVVVDLEEEIRTLKKRISDRERYELVEDYPGTYTLRIKEVCRNGEPVHYLCAGCMDNHSVKSILQFTNRDKRVAKCIPCKQFYDFRDSPSIDYN